MESKAQGWTKTLDVHETIEVGSFNENKFASWDQTISLSGLKNEIKINGTTFFWLKFNNFKKNNLTSHNYQVRY